MSYQDLKNCRMITAFITPFHEDGSINFEAIPPLIEHLLPTIQMGSFWLVPQQKAQP